MIPFLTDHWIDIVPLVSALALLVRSEAMALDPTTRANGIIHGQKLAKEALAVKLVPEDDSKNSSASE